MDGQAGDADRGKLIATAHLGMNVYGSGVEDARLTPAPAIRL
jgi:hypothetical protein